MSINLTLRMHGELGCDPTLVSLAEGCGSTSSGHSGGSQ